MALVVVHQIEDLSVEYLLGWFVLKVGLELKGGHDVERQCRNFVAGTAHFATGCGVLEKSVEHLGYASQFDSIISVDVCVRFQAFTERTLAVLCRFRKAL